MNAPQSSTDNWQAVAAAAREALPADVVTLIDEVRDKDHSESYLIPVLHRLQEIEGYLGADQLSAVAQLLQVPAAEVTGVATFYHFFRLEQKGRFSISVCMGTACYVRGADRVFQRLRQELGIDVGETTRDGLFSLEASRCLGTCGLAPVVMVNDDVHANVTPDDVPKLLDACRSRPVA